MASTLKHLRSSTSDKRPTASGLADGQLAINTASGTPALFFKDNHGAVVKVGPAHVGAAAPNAVPAGSAGNSLGELWVNNGLTTAGLNYYTGSGFVNLTPSGTETTIGLVELATAAETQTGTDAVRAVTPSGLQSKVSDSTSTTSSTTIASSTAVKTAYDLAHGALPKTGGIITGALEIGTTGSLVFEGSSNDSFDTTIAVVNPTASRVFTLPNISGTAITNADTGTVTSTMIANDTIVNADINSAAAIAYSKLALSSGIVNTDINASAAIAYGKLALSSGIINTDISASAEIAVSKLADGAARQLLQTDAAGTGVEWASNIDVPGTLDVTSAATFDSTVSIPLGAAATPSLYFGADSNTGIYSPGADQVAVSTGGTERARIDSSGRVGIGTTSPSAPLEVTSAAVNGVASEGIRIHMPGSFGGGLSGNSLLFTAQDSGSSKVIYSSIASLISSNTAGSHAGILTFNTVLGGTNTERVRIDSSGRLGLGTSSPDRLLHVSAADTAYIRLENQDSTGSVDQYVGLIEFEGQDSGGSGVRAQIGGIYEGVSGATALVFGTSADAGSVTERLRINRNGNVGIGTTSPAELLHISSTTAEAVAQVQTTFASGSVRLNLYANSGGVSQIRLGDEGSVNVGAITYDHPTDSMAFRTNGSERARIDSSGRLGLGTSSPVNLLHVQGDATFEQNAGGQFAIRGSTNTANRLNFGFETTNNYAWIQSITAGTAFRPIALNPSGGNVGIGTTSPVARLHIENTAGGDLFYALGSDSDVFKISSDSSTINLDTRNTTGGLAFQIQGTERARIDSSGRLLIGNSVSQSVESAERLLQVQGTGATTGIQVLRHTAGSAGAVFAFGKTRGSALNSVTAVIQNDVLGRITFAGANGTDVNSRGAEIAAFVDGTPGADDMPGRLVFSTTADGASSPTEQMRITSDAYVRLAAGTGGIQFNGDTAAVNALDDYEEGTFTPVLEGTTIVGTGTYSVQVGRYTKIGDRVFFQIILAWSAHTGTGNMEVNGLPFTSTSASNSQSPISLRVSAITSPASTVIQASTVVNTQKILIESVAIATGTAAALAIDTSGSLRFAGFYEVA